jgi:uncharacterized damage-inducible protein DinB
MNTLQEPKTLNTIQQLVKELEQEARTTRKMLAIVPDDKYAWKPHEKSMSLQQLATHIAELPGWVTMTLKTKELDFANNPYEAKSISKTKDLLTFFEETLAEAKTDLSKAKESDLLPNWTLRNGDEIYSVSTKAEVIRMTFCQIVHHRAQLGVYLRLLNVPIPGSYGPSADDASF